TPVRAAGWKEQLKHQWGEQAYLRARANEPERAGLAVALPLRRATAVIESIAAHGGYVSIQLYGHPSVAGEDSPMITPWFQVRAVARQESLASRTPRLTRAPSPANGRTAMPASKQAAAKSMVCSPSRTQTKLASVRGTVQPSAIRASRTLVRSSTVSSTRSNS